MDKAEARSPRDLHISNDGETLVMDRPGDIYLYDTESLDEVLALDIPGQSSVRYLGQDEHSATSWTEHARLSPDGSKLLVNDGAGGLWLLGAGDGAILRKFSRDRLPFVEDTIWLDNSNFAAIGNDGHVRKMAIDGTELLFDEKDVD